MKMVDSISQNGGGIRILKPKENLPHNGEVIESSEESLIKVRQMDQTGSLTKGVWGREVVVAGT